MERIVVVFCISSSVNLMADIRRAGYEPILLEPWCPESKREIYRKKFDLEYDNIPGERPAIVQGCEDG